MVGSVYDRVGKLDGKTPGKCQGPLGNTELLTAMWRGWGGMGRPNGSVTDLSALHVKCERLHILTTQHALVENNFRTKVDIGWNFTLLEGLPKNA